MTAGKGSRTKALQVLAGQRQMYERMYCDGVRKCIEAAGRGHVVKAELLDFVSRCEQRVTLILALEAAIEAGGALVDEILAEDLS